MDTEIRVDVIGRKLVEIRQVFKWDDNGLDWAWNYFILDSGVAFCLGDVNYVDGFYIDDVPAEAGPIEHELLSSVYGQKIVDTLQESPDSDTYHESPYLLMENRFLVTDVDAAPHGTGSAGVYVFKPEEIEASRLVPFVATLP